jgi:hypothetical protein
VRLAIKQQTLKKLFAKATLNLSFEKAITSLRPLSQDKLRYHENTNYKKIL